MEALCVRFATPEDAPAMLEIFSYYVRNTAVSFAWEPPTLPAFRALLQEVQEHYPWLLAEQDGRVLGYAYAHPFIPRRSYDWSAELTIYIAPEFRGQGIGSRLYRELETILDQMGVQNLYACIGWADEEDEHLTHASPLFHAAMGYRRVGEFRRCGRKFGNWYDMVWMEKVIGSHEPDPRPFRPLEEIGTEV